MKYVNKGTVFLSLLVISVLAVIMTFLFIEKESDTYDWLIHDDAIEFIETGDDFENQSCGQVKNATQGSFRLPVTEADETIETYLIDDHLSVELDFGTCSTYGMTHILSRHAPEHFIGDPTQVQSFFDPGLSIEQYEEIIDHIIAENEEEIMDQGFTEDGVVVYGDIDEGSVRLVIKGGKVITMYPDGWGLGDHQ